MIGLCWIASNTGCYVVSETASKGQGQLELLLVQEQQLRQISTSQNIDLQRKVTID
jgi:hypothetical protein